MKLIFNQPRKVLGAFYKKSTEPQKVPDEAQDDWYFKLLLKSGDITVPPGENVKVPQGPFGPPKAKVDIKQSRG